MRIGGCLRVAILLLAVLLILLGLLILLAVAVDAVIMNRVRDLWARSELQMEAVTDERPKREESSYVP